MSKAPVTFDERTHQIELDLPSPVHDAEALFKEARRRRRHRQTAVAAGVLIVVAIAVGSVLVAGGGSNGPGRSGLERHGSPHPVSQSQQQQRTQTAAPLPVYPPAQMIGSADIELAWAATGNALEISSDSGQTWRSVTPPTLQGVTVSADITAVDANGTSDLWVAVSDVPGLVTQPNSASSRGEGIERSSDGGRSWTFVALPGCLQTCGPISLSIVDAQTGFAVATSLQGQGSSVFSTHDGGSTWTEIGSLPNLGGLEVGGPLEGSQLVFTSNRDGWAVPGLSGGSYNVPQTSGGVIYRTTDGGVSWSAVQGLPSGLQYTLPVFFGAQDAVTLATKGWPGYKDPVVFTTQDGGATWTSEPIPPFVGSQFQPGSIATRFAAVGPQDWRIDTGSRLYETTNGGRNWGSFRPLPVVGLGDVEGVEFSSPKFGMAIEQNPVCFTKAVADTPSYNCYPVLTITSDGGRSWSPANL